MIQQQIQKNHKSKWTLIIIYLVWTVLTIGFAFLIRTWAENQMDFPPKEFLYFIGIIIWIIFSAVIFLLAKQKVTAGIFGILFIVILIYILISLF